MTLLFPDRQLDMVRTMIDMYREHGWLPKWELYGRETLTMEGDPAIPVIVDTWMKGLRDFDLETAYEAMRKSATAPGAENLMRPDPTPLNITLPTSPSPALPQHWGKRRMPSSFMNVP